MNNGDIESVCVEITNKKHKNIIVNTLYRPPTGKINPFQSFLKDIIAKNYKTSKKIYLIGDFNLNVLDYETNTKVKGFINLLFQHGLIPIINKPTKITKTTAKAIDHIIN